MSSGELEPGSLLSRFTIEDILGRGGMGIVYKVRDPKSKMPYAAKVLNRAAIGERDFVRRFKREAKAAKRLTHMNIVHVFKMRRWRSTYFYVMEYLDGRPLDAALKEHEFSFDRRIAIMRDVAAALDHIHRKGYAHRDIKPGNVLIRSDGLLKIIDFGLAQKLGRVKRTKSGHVMGTAKYMAPELIEGTYVSPATDMYSLGVMAYELLAGRAPFEADHGTVLTDMHLYVKPKPLLEVVKDVNRDLCLLVDRMLAKRQSRRAHSARAVHSWLDFYLTTGRFADLPRGL